jgi:hypothetical protein
MNNPNNLVIPALVICLLLFLRIRRIMRFQIYSPGALVLRAVLFAVFAFMSLATAILNPLTLLADVVGIVIGLGLLYFGVQHAVFEKREKGLFYRTHIWVEIVILILFVARYAYRFYLLRQGGVMQGEEDAQPDLNRQFQSLAADPLTGLTLFIIYTYYTGYFLYIYQKGKKVLAVQSVQPAEPQQPPKI